MKRPSFQFYPGDWLSNTKLRRCSEAARGAWIDILCLLHDSEEYGVIRWPLVELARAAGVAVKHAKELVAKGVLKGSETACAAFTHTPRHAGKDGEPVTLLEASKGPCWYCSRFLRDEWKKNRQGGATRFGSGDENPNTKPHKQNRPSRSPTPRLGERMGERSGRDLGDGSSTSSSSSTSLRESEGARSFEVPTLEEVRRHAKSAPVPITQACADRFFEDQEAIGWIIKGFPIAKWRNALNAYASRWNENEKARPKGASGDDGWTPAFPGQKRPTPPQ